MRKRTTVVVSVAGAATIALAGCSSSGGGGSASTSSATSSPATSNPAAATTSSAAPTTSAVPSSSAAAGNAAPVTVNKSFADPVMGDKGTVLKYVRNYQPSAAAKQKYSALADEDVILVDMKATASSKYYDTLGADSFYLTGTSNGIDQASTTILDSEVKAAGYPPLPDADTGKTTTGWVVFTPQKGLTKVVLRYKRLAAKTSNGKTITAKNFDIPLG